MTDMEKISAALEGALRLIPELVAEIERMRALANDAAESATQHQTELLRLRTADAPAIDSGIDRAAALVNRCTAQQVRDAWRFVEALEVTA